MSRVRGSGQGRTIVLIAIAVTLAACSDSEPLVGERSSGAATDEAEPIGAAKGLSETQRTHLVEEGETVWDVDYGADTVVVAGEALDTLKSGDDAAGVHTFDTAAADAAGLDLAEGRVLLIAGRSLGHITDIDAEGDHTIVQTERASLADAIEEGTVAWDVPIEFDFDQFVTEAASSQEDQASDRPPDPRAGQNAGDVRLTQISMQTAEGLIIPIRSEPRLAEATTPTIKVDEEAGTVSWTYEADGNEYKFRLTSNDDGVDVLVVVSREAKGETAMAFRGEGSMTDLRAAGSSSYSDGELASSTIEVQQLASDVDLSLAVAGAGVTPVDFTVPAPMFTFTWLVGPIPVTLDVTAEIIGTVNAQADASATAEASFTYRGDVGFAFEGTEVSASGNTDIAEMDPQPADSAANMGINVDAQFGLGFPRVSLSVLGQGLVPHLRSGAVLGSSLEWGDPAAGFPASSVCKTAYVRSEVSGGYDFTVLGKSLASDKFVLYDDENRTQNDSCPDE